MLREIAKTRALIISACLCAALAAGGSAAHAQIGSLQSTAKHAQAWHSKEASFYKRNWGVDIIGVRAVSSGWMLRFDYRVLDEKKAKPLFAKTVAPYLVDEATGARLAVPTMENIGELRQSPEPEPNRTYFMIFGNPNRLVKPGGRVSVVIGNFHVDGLTVD